MTVAGAAGGEGLPVPTWVAVLVVLGALAAITFATAKWVQRFRDR